MPSWRAAVARLMRPAVLPGMLVVGGCYVYREPRGPIPEAGTRVTIRLAKYATDSLATELGPSVQYVEGVVVREDSTGLELAVRRVEGRGAWSNPWNGERFTFPHGVYYDVEERHLNVAVSVLLGGLAVGTVVAMAHAFGSAGSAGPQGPVVGGPAQ